MMALTHWVCNRMFPLFLKRTADAMAPRLYVVFRRLVRLGCFPSCWRQANVPQFRMLHRPPLLPITNRFPWHQYCLRCLKSWCLFVLDDLWNGVVCFQPRSLFIGKVWVPVMHFCACPIQSKVHWRVGRRVASCRLISVQPLIGSPIRAFSSSSVCPVGIGGSVLSILTSFLSNRSQHVIVDGGRSKLVLCSSCALRSFYHF